MNWEKIQSAEEENVFAAFFERSKTRGIVAGTVVVNTTMRSGS